MPSTLDALATSRHVESTYLRYLLSTFRPRRPSFARELEAELGRSRIAKGPFLQATPAFETGASLGDLIEEGLLSRQLRRLPPSVFARPLYRHQEEAIRKAVDGRNLVVATGTGSGKTESFLLPILNGLMREAEQGTLGQPGVRALLLYPMNALANDQVKRLRIMLADLPEITFGRYIGETWRTQQEADKEFHHHYPGEPRLPNELLSREVMQVRPPHLLLTNYAMLEYLLLRPDDSTLFDGPTGRYWRHIVLDEAHVYNGAQGAEVGMLLRRVRDRVTAGRPGAIQAFATSATLGSGRNDYPALLDFAQTLTGERFEWVDRDPRRQDVVEAHRSALTQGETRHQLTDESIRELQHAYRSGAGADALTKIVASEGVVTAAPGSAVDATEAWLYELLRHDGRVLELQRLLQGAAQPLDTLAEQLFDRPEDLVSLVDLCVAAKPASDSGPLLPARYHHFLRALEVAQICLHPEHDDREPRLHLSRSLTCPSCRRRNIKSAMFELGVCRTCRSEYVVGLFGSGGGVIKSAPEDAQPKYLLIEGLTGGDDEDDEVALTNSTSYQLSAGRLCTQCSWFSPGGACRCSDPRPVDVTFVDPGEGERLHRCPVCNSRVDGDIVTRFVSGADAPASVVATAIYQELPASTDPIEATFMGQGRRLLTFSDSRQDAAFFAPFLERTYARGVQRRLMYGALKSDDEHAMEDLESPIRFSAGDAMVIDPDSTPLSQKNEVRAWLAEEVLAFDRRLSLEGSGLAEISVAVPHRYQTPRFLIDAGFTDPEALDLIQLMLTTVRLQGAVEMPDGVDIRDERFAPRNQKIGLRQEAPARNVVSWVPGSGLNRRLDLLTRIKETRGAHFDCDALLRQLWEYLTAPDSPWGQRTWITNHDRQTGLLHRLSWDRLRVTRLHREHRPGRCNRCNQLWWRTVDGVCPGWRCPGRVAAVPDIEELARDHYAALYQELKPTALSASEHTAQWRSERGSQLQQDFTNGKLNVLSCSTTFELGVDVGDVQAVLLKNVPPSPSNYVQRAGRAGRRSDSAALVVTFAQRRSHDLTYFNRPDLMVNGIVEPPLIQLDNPSIVRRHVHSMAFALFERMTADAGTAPHQDVESFFIAPSDDDAALGLPPAHQQFANWLSAHPDQLRDALERVVPPALHAELGITDWAWVQALTTLSGDEPTFGWLHRAATEAIEDIELLDEEYQKAKDDDQLPRAQSIKRMRRTLAGQQLIGYLSRKNVLPKYGFPVDVVELDVAGSGTDMAANLELSRDLKVALSEYSPGRRIVAGGRLWESRGLKRRQGMEWVSYRWSVCGECGAFRHRIGEGVDERCPRCESTVIERGHSGTFVIPSFGFVGDDAGPSGQTRPPRTATAETYFGAYKDSEPDFEPHRVADTGGVLQIRTSRQGRIAVVNRGPGGRGYGICMWCGANVARADGPGKRKTAPKGHPRLGRPGVECTGRINLLHLGHEFLTDTLEIVIDTDQLLPVLRSTLYALVEGAADLGIPRDDLDGALNPIGRHRNSLVIYDAVPGGAGHAQRIAADLDRVLRAAHNRVASCTDCEEDTSCYSCLRSYSNQRYHDGLHRGHARDLLAVLLGSRAEDQLIGLDLVDDVETRELLKGLHEAGAPVPTIGHELPNSSRSVVELAWVSQRFGITVGEDDERDHHLKANKWTFGPASQFTVDEVLRHLKG